MCLGIPGQVTEIFNDGSSLAKVKICGVYRDVNIDLVHFPSEPLKIGEWVLVHVGFAMSKIDEDEAMKTLELFQEIQEKTEELAE